MRRFSSLLPFPPLLVLVLMLGSACGLPRDTDGSLDRARGGVRRVGVADHPPWDRVTARTVSPWYARVAFSRSCRTDRAGGALVLTVMPVSALTDAVMPKQPEAS